MSTNTSIILLRHLSRLMVNGQPLWALAWANENFEAKHPLRLALVRRANELICQGVLGSEGVSRLLAGASLSEIDPSQVVALRGEVSTKRTRSIPTPGKIYHRRIANRCSIPREAPTISRKLR